MLPSLNFSLMICKRPLSKRFATYLAWLFLSLLGIATRIYLMGFLPHLVGLLLLRFSLELECTLRGFFLEEDFECCLFLFLRWCFPDLSLLFQKKFHRGRTQALLARIRCLVLRTKGKYSWVAADLDHAVHKFE